MVLDCVTIVSTTISLLMNGICCVYQQQEEQKLRDGIRQDIRTEYMYHRRRQEQYDEEDVFFRPIQFVDEDDPTKLVSMRESIVQDDPDVSSKDILDQQNERRMKLMHVKMHYMKVSSKQSITDNDTKRNNNEETDHPLTFGRPNESMVSQQTTVRFHHDDVHSPFIDYSQQQQIQQTDDIDEEINSIMTPSSWTTIPIS